MAPPDKYKVYLQDRKNKPRDILVTLCPPIKSVFSYLGRTYHFASMDDVAGTITYTDTLPNGR